MTEFTQCDLFGGAIVVQLPSHFGDASQRRQIPDHQEVFVDFSGNDHISATFDILEYVQGSGSGANAAALQYHFNDIIDDTEERVFWQATDVSLPKMPAIRSLNAMSVLKAHKPNRPNGKPAPKSDPDFYGILMTLVRLPDQGTDIVISVNVPYVPGEFDRKEIEEGRFGPLMDRGLAMQRKVLETFEIKDYSLFVN